MISMRMHSITCAWIEIVSSACSRPEGESSFELVEAAAGRRPPKRVEISPKPKPPPSACSGRLPTEEKAVEPRDALRQSFAWRPRRRKRHHGRMLGAERI